MVSPGGGAAAGGGGARRRPRAARGGGRSAEPGAARGSAVGSGVMGRPQGWAALGIEPSGPVSGYFPKVLEFLLMRRGGFPSVVWPGL